MLPAHAHYVIIGAGIHGLSTAMHLAQGAQGARKVRRCGGGTRIVVLDKTGHRRRRLGHRVRRRAQQLLPAGDARADGAFGVGLGTRSRGVQLPSGRLHADQPRGDARAGRHDLRAAEGDRLRVRLHRRRSRVDALHARDSSTTGRRRTSRRCCTKSAAATRTTWRRCAASRARPRRWASRSSPASR